MLFVVGVSDGLNEIIKSRDAAAVVWRTCELAIDADWMARVGQEGKLLFKDDGVLPVIAEIVSVEKLGAGPPEYTAELNIAFIFDRRHSHVEIFGVPFAVFVRSRGLPLRGHARRVSMT